MNLHSAINFKSMLTERDGKINKKLDYSHLFLALFLLNRTLYITNEVTIDQIVKVHLLIYVVMKYESIISCCGFHLLQSSKKAGVMICLDKWFLFYALY